MEWVWVRDILDALFLGENSFRLLKYSQNDEKLVFTLWWVSKLAYCTSDFFHVMLLLRSIILPLDLQNFINLDIYSRALILGLERFDTYSWVITPKCSGPVHVIYFHNWLKNTHDCLEPFVKKIWSFLRLLIHSQPIPLVLMCIPQKDYRS